LAKPIKNQASTTSTLTSFVTKAHQTVSHHTTNAVTEGQIQFLLR